MTSDRIGAHALSSYNFTQDQLDFLCGGGKWNGAAAAMGIEEHKRPSQVLGKRMGTVVRIKLILVWSFGLFFVTAISLCALFGILVMRFLNKKVFNRFITFFVAVGVGSLSGSAVFHLLPQVRAL